MSKKMKIIIIIVGILTVSCVTAFIIKSGKKAESLTSDTKSNNDTNLVTPDSNNTSNSSKISDGYSKVAENGNLELYLNETNLGLRVKNKITNYVWNSGLDYKDEDLNQAWQGFAESAVTVEYMDNRNTIRQLSLTTDKAKIKVIKKTSGFTSYISFDNEGIKLTIDVTLNKDSISVKVPYSSLKESSDAFKIQSINLYPFFGATKGSQSPGFMFVPDGSGALISLDKKTIATQPFLGRVYGQDLGIVGVNNEDVTDNSRPPQQINMPVFGMAHSNNAFITEIENGDPYTEICAYPAGVTTPFNWITSRFVYRDTYFQPTDKQGNGITVNQKNKNVYDISLKYMFLSNSSASYVGMAKRYQQDLIDKGILKKLNDDKNKDMPVDLEFFAAENKKQLLWKTVIPMTTVDQMSSILKDLTNNNVKNMSVIVRGWTKGGITGSSPKHFPFESEVGSKNQWVNFVKDNENKGIPVYMDTDYIVAYTGAGGYKKTDIAQAISQQLLSFYNSYSYLNPNATSKLFNDELPKFTKYGMNNIAIDSIGEILDSAYNSKNTLSRSDTIKTYEKMFSSNDNKKYALYSPNQYLWKYANEDIDIPMGSSNYVLESEDVPFMQIVLKGYIKYYAPPSNFNANGTLDILKMIDYGSFPSFYLTNEDPVKLLDTETKWLYTSQYSVWKNEILKEYGMINKALKSVKNAEFINRKEMADGIVMDTYSNGVSIIINYNKENYNYTNITVPAENFIVIGGVKK